MTTTLEPSRAARARANALGWVAEAPGQRRDRKRIAAGVVLVLICGWLAAVLYLNAGSREEVVAVARPVDRFSEVSREDFGVVRVAADSDVATMPAGRLDEVVGRRAAVALVPGTLLSDEQLLAADAQVVGEGEVAVGAVLSPQAAPGQLAAGDVVDVVVRPEGGGTEGVQSLEGRVLEVTDAEIPGTEGVRVSLVVPIEHAASVSSAAAEDRVSVAVRGQP